MELSIKEWLESNHKRYGICTLLGTVVGEAAYLADANQMVEEYEGLIPVHVLDSVTNPNWTK